jgi:hypothetical protein
MSITTRVSTIIIIIKWITISESISVAIIWVIKSTPRIKKRIVKTTIPSTIPSTVPAIAVTYTKTIKEKWIVVKSAIGRRVIAKTIVL